MSIETVYGLCNVSGSDPRYNYSDACLIEKQGRDSQSGEWIELGAGRLLLVSLPLALLRMDGNHSKRDRQLAI